MEKPPPVLDIKDATLQQLIDELKLRTDEFIVLGKINRRKDEDEEIWDHKGSHSQIAGLLRQGSIYWEQEIIDRWHNELLEGAEDEDEDEE